MGKAVFDKDTPFDAAKGIAATVICRTERGNLHAGIVYRARAGIASVIHLGWQDTLSFTWQWERLWAAPEVEPERLRSVGTRCRQISAKFLKDKTFPYALRFCDTTFSDDGALVLGANAKGLSCATFLLAVFRSVGIELIAADGWPVRPHLNEEFLELVEPFASAHHFAILKSECEEGVARILPEEVVAACEFSPPSTFVQCEAGGQEILGRLLRVTPE